MSAQKKSSIILKATLDDTTRRLTLPVNPAPTWASLSSSLRQLFTLDHQNFVLQYQDSDDDTVTFSTDVELAELWESAIVTSNNATIPVKIVLPSITPTLVDNETTADDATLLAQIKTAVGEDPTFVHQLHRLIHETRWAHRSDRQFDPMGRGGFRGRGGHRGGKSHCGRKHRHGAGDESSSSSDSDKGEKSDEEHHYRNYRKFLFLLSRNDHDSDTFCSGHSRPGDHHGHGHGRGGFEFGQGRGGYHFQSPFAFGFGSPGPFKRSAHDPPPFTFDFGAHRG